MCLAAFTRRGGVRGYVGLVGRRFPIRPGTQISFGETHGASALCRHTVHCSPSLISMNVRFCPTIPLVRCLGFFLVCTPPSAFLERNCECYLDLFAFFFFVYMDRLGETDVPDAVSVCFRQHQGDGFGNPRRLTGCDSCRVVLRPPYHPPLLRVWR